MINLGLQVMRPAKVQPEEKGRERLFAAGNYAPQNYFLWISYCIQSKIKRSPDINWNFNSIGYETPPSKRNNQRSGCCTSLIQRGRRREKEEKHKKVGGKNQYFCHTYALFSSAFLFYLAFLFVWVCSFPFSFFYTVIINGWLTDYFSFYFRTYFFVVNHGRYKCR